MVTSMALWPTICYAESLANCEAREIVTSQRRTSVR